MKRERMRLTIKARVRAWKSILVAIITMDVESTEAVHALKLLEAIERYFTGSSNELQQFGTLFLVVGSNSSPEPLDLRGRSSVVMILGIALPVININFRQTRNQKLQLLLVEDCDKVSRNNVMETCKCQ